MMKKRLSAILIGIALGIFLYGIASKYFDYMSYELSEQSNQDYLTCWGVNAETSLGNGLCIRYSYTYLNNTSYFNEYWNLQFEFVAGGTWGTNGKTDIIVFRPLSIQRYFNKDSK
jgi:hypothetical protein